MSNVLKVKTARAGKFWGQELPAGADVTDNFDPDDMTSMQMLLTKAVKLVPEKVEDAPVDKTARTRSK
jgi:hypothetical protein